MRRVARRSIIISKAEVPDVGLLMEVRRGRVRWRVRWRVGDLWVRCKGPRSRVSGMLRRRVKCADMFVV